MSNTTILQAPELKIDKRLYKHGPVPSLVKLERRIVWNLIAHLEAAGFKLHSVYDGDDETSVTTATEAMELIFNLDDASLRFRNKLDETDWHGILLVGGNGCDIISDWNYTKDDRDGFNAAMEAFDAEQFA